MLGLGLGVSSGSSGSQTRESILVSEFNKRVKADGGAVENASCLYKAVRALL